MVFRVSFLAAGIRTEIERSIGAWRSSAIVSARTRYGTGNV